VNYKNYEKVKNRGNYRPKREIIAISQKFPGHIKNFILAEENEKHGLIFKNKIILQLKKF
jgi:hypothetical protein